MNKRCPSCGACKECGAHPPQVVPMPYPVYPYVQPWTQPPWYPGTSPLTYPGPIWYGGGNISVGVTSGGTTTNPPTFQTHAGGQYQ